MWAALVGLASTACDAGEPDWVASDAPPPHVVDVLVTTGVDGDGKAITAGLQDAAPLTSTSFAIIVDRYLDPRTPIRQAYCLRSEAASQPTSALDCVGALSTRPTYDPVSRTLRVYVDAALTPATTYTFTVFAAVDAAAFGLRALDGLPLDAPYHVSFTTSEDLPDRELESPADLDEGIVTCNDARVLFAGCTTCHKDSELIDGQPVPNAPMGLSFEPLGLPLAIDRVAHQTAQGDQGSEAAKRPARFGAGMPIIQRSNPGNSYALYKVLARARYYPDTMADGELERLQSWIVGSPMPSHEVVAIENPDDPDGDPIEVSAAITQGALRRISNWIATGANCESE